MAGSALCPQDVATLQYRAPNLAVSCLAQALTIPPAEALILDAACGTGLVAVEVRAPRHPCLQLPHTLCLPKGHRVAHVDANQVPHLQLTTRGFVQLHGVDGSAGMLAQARARGLYQNLQLCTLGNEPLPSPEGTSTPSSEPLSPPWTKLHFAILYKPSSAPS